LPLFSGGGGFRVSAAAKNLDTYSGSEYVEPISQNEFDDIVVAIKNCREYEDILAKRMSHKEESVLLNMDSSCVPVLERKYLISDYYGFEFPEVVKANYIEDIIEMYRSAITKDDSIERISNVIGRNYSNLCIRELINVDLVGNSILQIGVKAASKEECSNIMSVIDEIITEATSDINKSFDYNFSYLSENYSEDYNVDVNNSKKAYIDDILAIERNIAGIPANLSENQKQIYNKFIKDDAFEGKQITYEDAVKIQNTIAEEKALELAKDGNKAPTNVSKTDKKHEVEESAKPPIVKRIVLGIIVGMFLTLCILIANYILDDKLKVANDLTSVFKCPVIEVIDDPKRVFDNNIFGKIDKKLDELLYHRKPYSDMLSLSASQIKLGIGGTDGNNILVTNSYDCGCNDKSLTDLVSRVKGLGEADKSYTTEYVERVTKNALEIEKIGNMDSAVIVEKIGESRYEDINKTIELIKNSGIKLIGAVVIQ